MGYTDKKKINVYSSLNNELIESFDYDDYFGNSYYDDEMFVKTSFTNYSFNRLLYNLLEKKDNFYIKIGYKGD